MLSPERLQKLLALVDLESVQELTIECNPADITAEYARYLKRLGFNRVSLGTQSFLDKELKFLGRRASSHQNILAFDCLRKAGFANISCDLIYGLPRQTLSDLRASIDELLALKPEHISTYLLSLEQGVPLFAEKKNLPEDEVLASFYREIGQKLPRAGYLQYELSNFCLPHCQSQHNLAYWQGKQYLAVGDGGCSYYKSGGAFFRTDGHGEFEELDQKQLESEFIFLHLRLTRGLLLSEYREKFGKDFLREYERILAKLADFLIVDKKRVALREDAYFVADAIMAEFVQV